MLQTKVVEETTTYILCSITFSENPAFYEIMWQNIVEAIDDNMAHAHCVLGT
jgi:hypothetical protein